MRSFVLAAAAAAISSVASAAPLTYNGSQSTIQYTLPYSNGCACWTGTQYINGTKIIYDSATDTYTLRDTGSASTTSTFTAADITSSTVNYDTYTKTSGSVTETFRVLNAGNTLIPTLTYVRYGQWRREGLSGFFATNDTYVVFGDKTPRSSMPTTGTGSYTTLYDGTWVNKDGVYAVSGNGTLTATFGTGAIAYTASLTGAPEAGGSSINFGAFAGNGSIANGGPSFKGSSPFNGNGYALNIWGNFYGTGAGAADEVGGNFSLRGDSTHRGSGTGAFVGD